MGVPIFDTTLVTVTRLLARRQPVPSGSRSHQPSPGAHGPPRAGRRRAHLHGGRVPRTRRARRSAASTGCRPTCSSPRSGSWGCSSACCSPWSRTQTSDQFRSFHHCRGVTRRRRVTRRADWRAGSSCQAAHMSRTGVRCLIQPNRSSEHPDLQPPSGLWGPARSMSVKWMAQVRERALVRELPPHAAERDGSRIVNEYRRGPNRPRSTCGSSS